MIGTDGEIHNGRLKYFFLQIRLVHTKENKVKPKRCKYVCVYMVEN